MHTSDPVRRLCAAVAAHGDADEPPDGEIGRWLVGTVRHVCLAAGLDRLFLQEQPPADPPEPATVLLVMPTGMNEARVITGLVARLDDAAARSAAAGTRPFRLTVAFDQGITRLSESGLFEGRVVTAVRRLSTAEPVRAALADGPGIAAVVAAPLLDDLAPPGPDGGRAGFRPLTVDLPGQRLAAWLRPPGLAFHLLDQA